MINLNVSIMHANNSKSLVHIFTKTRPNFLLKSMIFRVCVILFVHLNLILFVLFQAAFIMLINWKLCKMDGLLPWVQLLLWLKISEK